MAEGTSIRLPGTPKPWMNAAVSMALRLPGLRSALGRSLILLTVTGASSGNRYRTPVQYVRDGDRLLVLSQRHRRWWRNIASRPEVEVLLRGETIRAKAHLADGEEAREAIRTCLAVEPRLRKFYGLETGPDGEPSEQGVLQLDEAFAVIVISVPAM